MKKDVELLEAARTGDISRVKKLLLSNKPNTWKLASFGLKSRPNVNCHDSSGYNPIHHAALNGHKEVVQLLLENAASTNNGDLKGNSPLHLASWNGHYEITEILLTQGPNIAKVNTKNKDDESPLHCAAQHGHCKCSQVLLNNGADPSICNIRHESPLDLASRYGRLSVVQILLYHQPSLLKQKSFSPLHVASRNGHKEIVELLLAHGADVNKNSENGTALHEAALFGKLDVVKLLLTRGANPHVLDPQHRTALELAKQLDTPTSKNIAKHILERIQDDNDYEPLVQNSVPFHAGSNEKFDASCGFLSFMPDKGFTQSWCRHSKRKRFTSKSVSCCNSKSLPCLSSASHSAALAFPFVSRYSSFHPSSSTSFPFHHFTGPVAASIHSLPSTSIKSRCNKVLDFHSMLPFSRNKDQMPSQPLHIITTHSETSDHMSVMSESHHHQSVDLHSSELNPVFEFKFSVKTKPLKLTRHEMSASSEHSDSPKPARLLHIQNRPPSPLQPPPEDEENSFDSLMDEDLPHLDQMLGKDVVSHDGSIIDCRQKARNFNSDFFDPNALGAVQSSPACMLNARGLNIVDNPPLYLPPSPHSALMQISATLQNAVSCDVVALPCDKVDATATHSDHAPIDGISSNQSAISRMKQPFFKDPANIDVVSLHSELIQQNSDTQQLDKIDKVGRDSAFEWDDSLSDRTEDFDMPLPIRKFRGLTRGSCVNQSMSLTSSSSPVQLLFHCMEDGHQTETNVFGEAHNAIGKQANHAKELAIAEYLCLNAAISNESKLSADLPSQEPPATEIRQKELDEVLLHKLPDLGSITDTIAAVRRHSQTGGETRSAPNTLASSVPCKDEEWVQIANATFTVGGELRRGSVYAKQFEETFFNIMTGSFTPSDVTSWLNEVVILPQYERVLVTNGFDDIQFLSDPILEEQDLIDMAITNSQHRLKILKEADKLPKPPGIPFADLLLQTSAVSEWLKTLRLSQYSNAFASSCCRTLTHLRAMSCDQIRQLVPKRGHAKRIIATLQIKPMNSFNNTTTSRNSDHSFACSLPDPARALFLASQSQGINLRPPNETNLEVSVSAWRHSQDDLVDGCCSYQAYYLGSMLIRELNGVESTKEACSKMKKSTDTMRKIPTITLSINYAGVKFIDFKSKHQIAEHEIQNISFASQDSLDLSTFAYVTHDNKTGNHYCHVFRVTTMDKAYEIILTLGQAFEIAYQLILKENSLKEHS